MRVIFRIATALLTLAAATGAFGNAATCSECLACRTQLNQPGFQCRFNGSVPDCRPGCDTTSNGCAGDDLYGECSYDGSGWWFERHYLASIEPAPLTVGNQWIVVAAQISTPRPMPQAGGSSARISH